MITWNTDVNAPCCPGEIVDGDTGETVLVQTDWDFPGTAGSFGWSVQNVQRCGPCGRVQAAPTAPVAGNATYCDDCNETTPLCEHNGTDGTVDCPACGLTAGDFISAAGEWLRENDGVTADDPGYFGN